MSDWASRLTAEERVLFYFATARGDALAAPLADFFAKTSQCYVPDNDTVAAEADYELVVRTLRDTLADLFLRWSDTEQEEMGDASAEPSEAGMDDEGSSR